MTENNNTNTTTTTPDEQTNVVDPNVAKIYVGNLPFTTRNAGLLDLFKDAGVEVSQANVVTKRYGHSSGYGFVQIDKADTDKAVALNGKDIEGRQIKVEIATSSAVPKKRAPRRNNRRKSTATKGAEGDDSGANTDASAKGSETPTGENKRRRPRRSRKPRKPADAKEDGETGASATGATSEGGDKQPAASRPRRTPKPKVARPPRSTEPKEISEDVVYVANIPFNLQDEELTEFFKDVGVVSAKTVSSFKQRNKGFGFVTVDSHENQLKAVETKNGAELNGRKLVVKRAYVRNEPEPGADATETPAAGATTAEPAAQQ